MVQRAKTVDCDKDKSTCVEKHKAQQTTIAAQARTKLIIIFFTVDRLATLACRVT